MADLAQRLEVNGRRIVVLAGPATGATRTSSRSRDAVAGRFDHFICRRDDNLRGRAPDEVPRIQAAALQARGVPEAAISIIPDEQAAIDAALGMGQPGDLLLIFADALTRSWKQITKFRSSPESAADVARGNGDGIGAFSTPAADPGRGQACSCPVAAKRRSGVVRDRRHDGGRIRAPARATAILAGLIRDERGVRLAPETED